MGQTKNIVFNYRTKLAICYIYLRSIAKCGTPKIMFLIIEQSYLLHIWEAYLVNVSHQKYCNLIVGQSCCKCCSYVWEAFVIQLQNSWLSHCLLGRSPCVQQNRSGLWSCLEHASSRCKTNGTGKKIINVCINIVLTLVWKFVWKLVSTHVSILVWKLVWILVWKSVWILVWKLVSTLISILWSALASKHVSTLVSAFY
jgi:hypothetical protein